MADITDINAAQSVKIIGSASDGAESVPVNSSVNGELTNVDTCNAEAIYGVLTVGTTPVEIKVGTSKLSGRKFLHLQSKDRGIYFGYSNSVSTSNGTELFKNQILFLPIGEAVSVWVIAGASGKEIRIGELA